MSSNNQVKTITPTPDESNKFTFKGKKLKL